MAVIKCKMCGGDLVIEPGATVAECEYCGTRQTIPNQDDEKKLTLFARANRLRMGCEFDKAAGIYESIVADFPQEAEAYWGLVLCKYGIEYVDDPATGKKIPTCHRSSFDSILEDSDFEQAQENADVVARKVYREEAKQIEEIRKGIIEVSGREEPYDIFICYKETDENGQRTVDSVIAQDVYDALTEKGYRVFFSRITLEDKLGQEYEPYIFAALNSAKIMLAFGTDYEYYNAVWVKNEWSRYLKLMAKDKTKHLIPCYKGIDAYDMPKEFAKLQAQDMGKVGAIQDLMRGIEKLLPKNEPAAVQEKVVYAAPADNRQSAQLDRGFMALEDGDWKKADGFFEEALNLDAHSAHAYIGKALAQEWCRNLHALVEKRLEQCQEVKTEQKIIQPEAAQLAHIEEAVQKYGIPNYLDSYIVKGLYKYDLSYPSDVSGREKQLEEQKQWWETHRLLSRAEQFAAGDTAKELQAEKKFLLDSLAQRIEEAKKAEKAAIEDTRRNYANFLAEADAKAEEKYRPCAKQREQDYQAWCAKAKAEKNTHFLKDLAAKFDKLENYRDSKAMAEFCRKRIEEENAREKEEQAHQARIYAQEQKRAAKRRKIALITVVAIAILAVAGYFAATKLVIPAIHYKQAQDYISAGDYTAAYALLEELGKHDEVAQNQYERGIVLLEMEDYDSAYQLLTEARSVKGAEEAIYEIATGLLNQGNMLKASAAFFSLGDYRDAREQSMSACPIATVWGSISVGYSHTVGLKYDGTVVAVGSNGLAQCNVTDWQDIIGVSAGDFHTVGLKINGTVVAAGDNSFSQCDVGNWKDITAVSAGGQHTVGLKADGTVVATGSDSNGQCTVSSWQDIIAISAGEFHTVGLKADGSVVAIGNNDVGQCNVGDWKDIVAISAGGYHTVGLKSDGTVVAAGNNKDGQCNVDNWHDILVVSAGSGHTVGLKSDGTVIAVGSDDSGRCNVGSWENIVAISAGDYNTVGLKSDGTVIAVGSDRNGQCNVGDWQDIKVPGAIQP